MRPQAAIAASARAVRPRRARRGGRADTARGAVRGRAAPGRPASCRRWSACWWPTGLARSLSEARRAVAEGGANINNVRITDPEHVPAAGDLLHGRYLVLRRGKKSVAGVELVPELVSVSAPCRVSEELTRERRSPGPGRIRRGCDRRLALRPAPIQQQMIMKQAADLQV